MDAFARTVEVVGLVIDGLGVLVIALGVVFASGRWLLRVNRVDDSYSRFRQDLGRGILLGLEFLVAADIIRTVAVKPTLSSVMVLASIVLIRTFLSVALEVEVEGRWPWAKNRPDVRK